MNTNNAANTTLEEQRREKTDGIAKEADLEVWPLPSDPVLVGREISREVPARRRARTAVLARQLG